MATNAVRWQAICDGLLNRTTTAAEQARLGSALAHGVDATAYAAMTNGEKLAYAVSAMRQLLMQRVKFAEGDAAEQAARDATATSVETAFAAVP